MPYVRFQRLTTGKSKEYLPLKKEFIVEYNDLVIIKSTKSRFVSLSIDGANFSRVIPTSIKLIRKDELKK